MTSNQENEMQKLKQSKVEAETQWQVLAKELYLQQTKYMEMQEMCNNWEKEKIKLQMKNGYIVRDLGGIMIYRPNLDLRFIFTWIPAHITLNKNIIRSCMRAGLSIAC